MKSIDLSKILKTNKLFLFLFLNVALEAVQHIWWRWFTGHQNQNQNMTRCQWLTDYREHTRTNGTNDILNKEVGTLLRGLEEPDRWALVVGLKKTRYWGKKRKWCLLVCCLLYLQRRESCCTPQLKTLGQQLKQEWRWQSLNMLLKAIKSYLKY